MRIETSKDSIKLIKKDGVFCIERDCYGGLVTAIAVSDSLKKRDSDDIWSAEY